MKIVSKKEGTGKTGIIKDENGYYKMILGAVNTYNSNGIFYKVDDVNKFNSEESILGRRINMGILRAEQDHPDTSSLNQRDMINRIVKIDLDRVCAHIKAVEFTTLNRCEDGWDGYPIHIVSAWIKPSGKFGPELKEALDNPDENVSFSIRSLVVEKTIGATLVRDIIDISTWDRVFEQGVSIANQWKAAGVESIGSGNADMCLNGSCIPKLKDLIASTEDSDIYEEVLQSLESHERKHTNPIFKI